MLTRSKSAYHTRFDPVAKEKEEYLKSLEEIVSLDSGFTVSHKIHRLRIVIIIKLKEALLANLSKLGRQSRNERFNIHEVCEDIQDCNTLRTYVSAARFVA